MLRLNVANGHTAVPEIAPAKSSPSTPETAAGEGRGARIASYAGSIMQNAIVQGANYFLRECCSEGLAAIGESYGGEVGKFYGKQSGVVAGYALQTVLEPGTTFLCAKVRKWVSPDFATNPKVDPEALEQYKLAAFVTSASGLAMAKGAANSAISFSEGASGIFQKAAVGAAATATQAGLVQFFSSLYAGLPGTGKPVEFPQFSLKSIGTKGLANLGCAAVKVVTNIGISGMKSVPERETLANDMIDMQAQAAVRYVVDKKLLADKKPPIFSDDNVDTDRAYARVLEQHYAGPKPVASSSANKKAFNPALVSPKLPKEATIIEMEPEIQAVTRF